MNKINILLTSVGGAAGVFLSKHLKKYNNLRLIGIDMSNLIAPQKWLDRFYQVPAVSDKEYFCKIEKIVERENIDVIIPITSYDMDAFCKEEKENKYGKKMLIMDNEMHRLLHNKLTCYQYFNTIGIKAPKILDEITSYPVILKAKEDSGSKRTFLLRSQEDYDFYSKRTEDSILVEYLEGPEYTVDCLFDKKGKCIGYNVRKRRKMNGGGAVISTNCEVEEVKSVISILESTGRIKGAVNFQFKIDKDGDVNVFDFNTRFASGGLPLTVQTGFDIPYLLIQLVLGEHVCTWERNKNSIGLTMIRYFDEVYIYE